MEKIKRVFRGILQNKVLLMSVLICAGMLMLVKTEAAAGSTSKGLKKLAKDVQDECALILINAYYNGDTDSYEKSNALDNRVKFRMVADIFDNKGKREATEKEFQKCSNLYFGSNTDMKGYPNYKKNGKKYYQLDVVLGDWGCDYPVTKVKSIKKLSDGKYMILSKHYVGDECEEANEPTFVGTSKMQVEKSSKGKYGFVIKKIGYKLAKP